MSAAGAHFLQQSWILTADSKSLRTVRRCFPNWTILKQLVVLLGLGLWTPCHWWVLRAHIESVGVDVCWLKKLPSSLETQACLEWWSSWWDEPGTIHVGHDVHGCAVELHFCHHDIVLSGLKSRESFQFHCSRLTWEDLKMPRQMQIITIRDAIWRLLGGTSCKNIVWRCCLIACLIIGASATWTHCLSFDGTAKNKLHPNGRTGPVFYSCFLKSRSAHSALSISCHTIKTMRCIMRKAKNMQVQGWTVDCQRHREEKVSMFIQYTTSKHQCLYVIIQYNS